MYLLDTVAISEAMKRRPNPGYAAWAVQQEPSTLFVSVITLAEIARGAALIQQRDPQQARHLESWLARLRAEFADRLLNVDEKIAVIWGRMMAGQPTPPYADALLAATALVHGLAVVTRNVRDFERTGATVVDPFA